MAPKAAETIAQSILSRKGIAAIWELEKAAAEAHRTGSETAAARIIEIADATERAWLHLQGSPGSSPAMDSHSATPHASRRTSASHLSSVDNPVTVLLSAVTAGTNRRQRLAIEAFSWAVMLAFIAGLLAEAYANSPGF